MAIVNTSSETLYSARNLRAVTPSNDVELDAGCRGLRVGTAGDGTLTVLARDDTSPVLISGVLAGEFIPVAARKVMATGTGASDIVAFY